MHRKYTKLSNELITSSIWCESDSTRIVWITLLALADRFGEVAGAIPGLARIANVEIEKARSALDYLKSPDAESRSKEYEGRRVEDIDGGWRILNYGKYSEMLSIDERRAYRARWMREKRRKEKALAVNPQYERSLKESEQKADAPSSF